ncbi:hypothetical protein [Streptomyces sp. NPDC059063]|uniref:hypothetical protein n=1 Tax=unclassified Streptomyces TaxID=2593676 RepID=UPI0036C1CA28
MSFIARMSERHTTKLAWLIVLAGVASAFVGDPLWRWAAGLGPGAGYAFGAFCGSGILCCWALASSALRHRQPVRCVVATALGSVAFLALACLVPGRNGRLFGSIGMPSDRRMWVEENPTVWAAIGAGLAVGALALWCVMPRRATGRRRSGPAKK